MEEQSQDEIEEQRTLARQKEERRYNRDSGLTREDNFLAEEVCDAICTTVTHDTTRSAEQA